ncbi:uncharacterized protein K02A2.6-like, partial [Eupeodes corollae]|uniref:uncharacterized protein K02A2.6-like n=1 Tax=Eupeodes corollae TaxID=290404 RepID=UPI002492E265
MTSVNESILTTTTSSSVREFRPHVDSWENWCELLDSHFLESAVTEDNMKVAILIKSIGLEAYGLLKDLCDPVLPSKKPFNELKDLLDTQYSIPVIVFRERRTFLEAKKSDTETASQWFARLKKLAKDCKFGQQLDAFVLNKFITGFEGKVFERLCEENEKLKLSEALKKAMAAEVKLITQQQQQTQKEVNFVSKRYQRGQRSSSNKQNSSNNNSKDSGSSRRRCSHCGWKNHTSEKCKYKSSTCNKCGRVGHLASVCSSSRQINLVEVSNNLSSEFNSNEDINTTSDYISNFSNFSIFSVTGEAVATPFTEAVKVNQVWLEFVLDTGAACSLVSLSIFDKFFDRKILKPCVDRFCAYNGETIQIVGEFKATVKYRERTRELRLIVSNTNSPPILGRDFMQLFDMTLSQINSIRYDHKQDDLVSRIKSKYRNVFKNELGTYKGNKIKLSISENAKPVFCKPRPVPLAWRSNIENQLNNLVKTGVLIPVENAEWGTPLVPIVKPNGDLRICGDYKTTVNKFLMDVKYPLPLINELFTSLQGNHFTKLDLSNAYNQLVLDEDSQLLCAWSTHVGVFKMTRLPFGVKPAAAIFQKTIETLLRGIPNAINYLDDIVVTGATTADHMKTLELVLGKLDSVGLRLNESKCEFFKERISYLGFNIDRFGLSKNKDRIASVLEAPIPQCVSEVRAFVGMINYYSKFIPNFAHKMAPLYNLLKKDVKFQWSKTCQEAYELLKQDVTSDQVLTHFNPKIPIVLSTDASNSAVAGVLSHIFANGVRKPIAFISRALSQTEKGYSTIQKEALAIVYSVSKLKQYLLGVHFTLESDHKPLLAIFGENKGLPVMAAARMQRWAFILSGFDYSIKYIKGELNQADHLSRIPQEEVGKISNDFSYINLVETDNQLKLDFKNIAKETRRDPILSKLVDAINSGTIDALMGEEFGPFRNKKNELSVEYNCILWGYRTIVPFKLREEVLKELHLSHLGIVKTKALARSYVWWPKIDHNIEKMISSCVSCKLTQSSPEKCPLIPWTPTESAWSRIHVDFAGPINGFYFLIIIDSYSKWVEVFKTHEMTSIFTINKLRDVFCRFGLVDTLVSDNGRQFISLDFQQFLANNGIKHILTAPGHPATNGQAENFVKTLKKSLQAILNDTGGGSKNMDLILNRFLFDYRCAKHCTTGESPAKLLLGKELKNRFSLMKPPLVREKICDKQLSNIKNFKGSRNVKFEEGENVYVRDYSNPNKDGWQPATVKKRIGSRSYSCVLTHNKRRIKRHSNQMISGTSNASPKSIDGRADNSPKETARVTAEPIVNADSEAVIATNGAEPSILESRSSR